MRYCRDCHSVNKFCLLDCSVLSVNVNVVYTLKQKVLKGMFNWWIRGLNRHRLHRWTIVHCSSYDVVKQAAVGGRQRGRRSRRRPVSEEWEILEGLKSGQQFDVEAPTKFSGYIMKSRKWPMKGWHKVSDSYWWIALLQIMSNTHLLLGCLLYTSDAADE